jgi:hypothetical protein
VLGGCLRRRGGRKCPGACASSSRKCSGLRLLSWR